MAYYEEEVGMTFATKLRHLLTGAGLTRCELANKASLCEISIRHYERGASVPSRPAAFSPVGLSSGLSCHFRAAAL